MFKNLKKRKMSQQLFGFPAHGAVLSKTTDGLTSAFGMRAGVSQSSLAVDSFINYVLNIKY